MTEIISTEHPLCLLRKEGVEAAPYRNSLAGNLYSWDHNTFVTQRENCLYNIYRQNIRAALIWHYQVYLPVFLTTWLNKSCSLTAISDLAFIWTDNSDNLLQQARVCVSLTHCNWIWIKTWNLNKCSTLNQKKNKERLKVCNWYELWKILLILLLLWQGFFPGVPAVITRLERGKFTL